MLSTKRSRGLLLTVWNFSFCAVKVYCPGGKSGILYDPSVSVVVLRVRFVPCSSAVTEAPGTGRPEASVTVPVKLPWACCARAGMVKPAKSINSHTKLMRCACRTALHRCLVNIRGPALSTARCSGGRKTARNGTLSLVANTSY